LGLTEALLDYEDLQDPYGIQFWPIFKGRDGCRTPMVWSHNEPNGGFSHAEKPWLPVPPEHLTSAVNLQADREESLLAHYKQMLAFRRDHQVFAKASIRFLGNDNDVLHFERGEGAEAITVVVNTSEKDVEVSIGSGIVPMSGSPYPEIAAKGGKIALGAYQAWFGQKG
ncbi:MAG: alpha-glucosidase C-terminal domain-containing protein, partial [Pseudomonadota bacterium]